MICECYYGFIGGLFSRGCHGSRRTFLNIHVKDFTEPGEGFFDDTLCHVSVEAAHKKGFGSFWMVFFDFVFKRSVEQSPIIIRTKKISLAISMLHTNMNPYMFIIDLSTRPSITNVHSLHNIVYVQHIVCYY